MWTLWTGNLEGWVEGATRTIRCRLPGEVKAIRVRDVLKSGAPGGRELVATVARRYRDRLWLVPGKAWVTR